MSRIIIKYSVILSVLLLCNHYIRMVPRVYNKIDAHSSSWIAIVILISVLLFGINSYVKHAYERDSYSYIFAFLVGSTIALSGSIIFSVISNTVFYSSHMSPILLDRIFNLVLRLYTIGCVASLIIPLTYRKSEGKKTESPADHLLE